VTRIIDTFELRANPQLITELREHPGANLERRVVPLHKVEVRANDDGTFAVAGHAAVFDDLSENLGGFRERIKRGAFKKVLRDDPDVRFLFNHDPNLVLARTHAGSLALKEDATGLEYDADCAPTSYAADLRVLLDRGEVTQSSFAFRVAPGGDEWIEDPDTGGLIREISEFSGLYDVSAVTYPAYPTTDVGLRALAGLNAGDARDLAWAIHRGERDASEEERQALDLILQSFSTVSPWTAERALRAFAVEPELLAAVPDQRAHIEMTATDADEAPDLWRTQARQPAELRVLSKASAGAGAEPRPDVVPARAHQRAARRLRRHARDRRSSRPTPARRCSGRRSPRTARRRGRRRTRPTPRRTRRSGRRR
jgi:HK97 family phage prohead protease